jgi:hypothetical protein
LVAPPHVLVEHGSPGRSSFVPSAISIELSQEHPVAEAKTVKTASDKPTVIAL